MNKNETFLDRFKDMPLPRLLIFSKKKTHPRAILENFENMDNVEKFFRTHIDKYN